MFGEFFSSLFLVFFCFEGGMRVMMMGVLIFGGEL